ncbi:Bacillolysin [Drechslerella dactyloides]|uniref:Bacillolysin n=1 Tax=Drechslerella dactyloides TaxID=74499 RepID=A0AAD6NI55_DREDA|nr:Bacillolysin [Drechslerella dactyloides]
MYVGPRYGVKMAKWCFIRPLDYLEDKLSDPSLSEAQRAKTKRDWKLTEQLQKQEHDAWNDAYRWRQDRIKAGEPTFGYAPTMRPPDIGQLPKSPSPEFRCQIWDVGQSFNVKHPVTGSIRYSTFEWPEGQAWNDHGGDTECEAAVDNFKAVYDVIGKLSTRDSYDGIGSSFIGCIHMGHPDGAVYNNAFWTPSLRRMYFGEHQTRIPDTVGHEMMHGITSTSVRLRDTFFSGALDESLSDCFGSMVRQWTIPPGQHGRSVETADWCIWNPDDDGKITEKLRSLADPPSCGYRRPHPKHMDKLSRSQNAQKAVDDDDYAFIHSNCGIPNHAFYSACRELQSRYAYSWDRIGVVWFRTVIDGYLRDDSNFAHLANMTCYVSRKLYPQEPAVEAAVAAAWKKVGITPAVQVARGVSRFKVVLEQRESANFIAGRKSRDFNSALIFAIRDYGAGSVEFGVYYKNSDSDYIWQNLNAALGLVPSEYIVTFDVVQDSELQTYVVCGSAYANDATKGRLFVWKPFRAENIEWGNQTAISSLIMPQIPTLPSPPARKVLIGSLDSKVNGVYPSIFLALRNAIARVEVKADRGSWTIANDLNLPNSVSRVLDISCGTAVGSSGMYVLYEPTEGVQKLLYTASSRPFEAPIQIPADTKITCITTIGQQLIAGGTGLWTVPDSAIGRSTATLQQIGTGINATELRTEQISGSDAFVHVLSQDGRLFKMTGGPGGWQVKKVTDGAQGFGLCNGKTEDGTGIPLIVKDEKGDFYEIDVSKDVGDWQKKPFY